jgi:hypothetical protein
MINRFNLPVVSAYQSETLPIGVRRGAAQGRTIPGINGRSLCIPQSRSAAGSGNSAAGDDGCLDSHTTGEHVNRLAQRAHRC